MSKQDVLRNAVAIVEMEGFAITEQNLKLIERCVNGEITITEVLDVIRNIRSTIGTMQIEGDMSKESIATLHDFVNGTLTLDEVINKHKREESP
jgi:hypothetical protein